IDPITNQPRETTYQYGTLGELRSVTLPDNTTIRYYQNANNQRIAKEVNGTIVQRYLWLNQTTLLGFYDQDNNFARFTYAADRTPMQMEYKGNIYYLSYDHQGSLKAVGNQSRRAVRQIDYDSFGNILKESNPTAGTSYQDLSLDSLDIPIGFAGGLYDKDTKLIRFGYRDYDPFTGRWTAKDPIDFNGGQGNLYVYVGNDPVNWVDPTGEFAWWVMGGIAGGLGNIIGMYAESRGNYSKMDYARAFVSGFAVGTISAGIGGIGAVSKTLKTGWALLGIGSDITLNALIGIDGVVRNGPPTTAPSKPPSVPTKPPNACEEDYKEPQR
ncbi:MAG: RHS repeat-associated core domain-containing protein, partial [Helicobacteraceae bacterium]|nr:RHS repeat-associated core domain-containing protein [Helicobacteraceae bacterium]